MLNRLSILVFAVAALVAAPRGAEAADFTVSSSGQGAYLINGQSNPALTLTRGKTYTFDVITANHPFWIKTVPEIGTDDSFDAGVTNNGCAPGLVTFAVPANAPAQLYYQCQFHEPMNGVITLVSPPPVANTVPAATDVSRALLASGLALLGLAALAMKARRRSHDLRQAR